MSERVDVLGIIDDTITMEEHDGQYISQDLRDVRAAVAELIEADREYDEAMEAAEDCEYSKSKRLAANKRLQKAEKRRAAALARFGGV